MENRTFTLHGYPQGPVFLVVREYKAAGFIPSVKGISLDGKRQTCARVVDVNFEVAS
jgi:hypothetical protein